MNNNIKYKYLKYKKKYIELKKIIGGGGENTLKTNIFDDLQDNIIFVFDVDCCLFLPPVVSISQRKEYAKQIKSKSNFTFKKIEDADMVYGIEFPGGYTEKEGYSTSTIGSYWLEDERKEYMNQARIEINGEEHIPGYNNGSVKIMSFIGAREVFEFLYNNKGKIKIAIASSADDEDSEIIMKYLLETLSVTKDKTFMDVIQEINNGVTIQRDYIEPFYENKPYYGEIGHREENNLSYDKNTHFKKIIKVFNQQTVLQRVRNIESNQNTESNQNIRYDNTSLLFFDDNPFKGPFSDRSIFKYHYSGVMTLDTGGWFIGLNIKNSNGEVIDAPKQGMSLNRLLLGMEMFIDYKDHLKKLSKNQVTIAFICKFVFWKYYVECLKKYGLDINAIHKNI